MNEYVVAAKAGVVCKKVRLPRIRIPETRARILLLMGVILFLCESH